MKFKSIRNRIVFNYMGAFLGTLLLMNIIIYMLSAGLIIRGKREILETNRDYLISRLEGIHADKIVVSRKRIEREIEDMRMHSSNLYIRLSQGDERYVGNLPIEIDEEIRGRSNFTIDGEDEEEYFYTSETYIYEGRDYLLELVLIADYEGYLKILVKVLVIVELLGLGVSIVAGMRTANSLIEPIKRMSDMTEKITSENLQERLPVGDREDEIARLSGLINEMLQGLEESFEGQRRFISNVSHELRTPIAVMKGYLDIYRRMGGDPNIAEEAIGAIEEENENMKRMIDKLLFLARGDLEGFHLEREEVDIYELLDRVRRGYDTVAGGEGIHLNIQDRFTIQCDINMVIQMMRAFVDNAFKYGGDGGIELGSCLEDGSSVIYVRDFGRGMDQEEMERIFERFYRGDESRNRDSGSMGLGLSMVVKLAEVHGCRIGLESEVGRGSKFKIIFPGEGV